MGNIQSQITKQTLASYTNVVNQTVETVQNQVAADCTAENTVNITTGQNCYFEILGNATITQNANNKCQLTSQAITDIGSSVYNNLNTATQNFINNDLKNSQGFFATALSLQSSVNLNATTISNMITNQFQSNISNTCQSFVTSANNGTINLCGVYGENFNYSQDAFNLSLTSCINQAVINTFTSNQVLNTLWSQTDSKLASKQSGFSLGVIGAIILIIVIVIVLIIVIRAISNSRKPKTANPNSGPRIPPEVVDTALA